MPKKRKLNSSNPKYKKTNKQDDIKVRKVFVGEIKGVKIYTIFSNDI